MSSSEAVEIRSYRSVFDLERRIYRIDRLRLNPGGVPVRGVLYFLASLICVLVLGALPVTGLVAHLFPWYIRDLGLPICMAALFTIIRVEGRPFHLAARSLIRYASGPRYLSGLRPCQPRGRSWHPPEILFLPDGSDARLRRMRFTGPGAALISVPHERAVWKSSLSRRSPHLTLTALSKQRPLSEGQVIELRRGVCLHVNGSPQTQRRLPLQTKRPGPHHRTRGHSSQTSTRAPARGCASQTGRGGRTGTRFKYG